MLVGRVKVCEDITRWDIPHNYAVRIRWMSYELRKIFPQRRCSKVNSKEQYEEEQHGCGGKSSAWCPYSLLELNSVSQLILLPIIML